MKIRNFLLGGAVAVLSLVSCEEEAPSLGSPDLKVSESEVVFDSEEAGFRDLTLTATRDWKVTSEEDWVTVDPSEGKASADPQTVKISVLENNDGFDRDAVLSFTIGSITKTVAVSQIGGKGSSSALVVYGNNFDKQEAFKDGNFWPEAASSDVWKNETGSGISAVNYEFGGKVSVRTSGKLSNDESGYSHYKGSGLNKIFFGAATSILKIKNIALPAGKTSFTLSFGGQKYGQDEPDNTFLFTEFKAYVSNDGAKWVALSPAFPEGADLVGDWNLASCTFAVPASVTSLSLAFECSASSVYSLDDVTLSVSETAGAELDFSAGTELGGTTGGNGNTGDVPAGTGEGTQASPYSAAKAYHVASALSSTGTTPGVYVQGIVKEIKEVSTQYGNATYYLTDEDGIAKFYVYRGKNLGNTAFTAADQIKVGDQVLVYGDLMNYMGNSPQLGQGNYIVKLNGVSGGVDPDAGSQTPESKGKKTVAEFLAAADTENYYELTGTVSGFNATYCSFDLTDASGAIYVYSVLSASKSQWVTKIANGGTITLYGKYYYYQDATDASKNKHEVIDAYIVSYTAPEGGEITPPAAGDGTYEPGVTWTLGSSAYDNTSTGTNNQTAVVNGVSVANLLKLGTSSKVGDATITIPAGTKKLGFYCVAWKGKTNTPVKFSAGSTELKSFVPQANTGATGNAPYTLTLADTDYYTVDIPDGTTSVKVETTSTSQGRVLFIGMKALTE